MLVRTFKFREIQRSFDAHHVTSLVKHCYKMRKCRKNYARRSALMLNLPLHIKPTQIHIIHEVIFCVLKIAKPLFDTFVFLNGSILKHS